MKNGKLPLQSKKPPTRLTADAVFGSPNAIPPDVQAEMDKNGWTPRWLNSKVVYANQGYHPKGWEVYRRPKKSDTVIDFKFGNDPEGVIRRGDQILGYKPKDRADQHRAYLVQQTRAQTGMLAKQGKELKEHAKNIGLDTTVSEGWDGEEDED